MQNYEIIYKTIQHCKKVNYTANNNNNNNMITVKKLKLV